MIEHRSTGTVAPPCLTPNDPRLPLDKRGRNGIATRLSEQRPAATLWPMFPIAERMSAALEGAYGAIGGHRTRFDRSDFR